MRIIDNVVSAITGRERLEDPIVPIRVCLYCIGSGEAPESNGTVTLQCRHCNGTGLEDKVVTQERALDILYGEKP